MEKYIGFGIPGANFIKEIVLFILIVVFSALSYHKYKKNKKCPFSFSWLDYAIFAYFAVMILVTLFTTGISGLIFGGRYDFIFLIAFLLVYHGQEYLQKSLSHYIKIFLYSAGIMLFISGLLKFPLSEDLLLFAGYSGYVSAWDFGGAPPIFHGIDGASVRRFQGLLDGPNTMGAFLILFSGILVHFARKHKDWYFVVGLIVFVVIMAIIYTYSRSALIGFIGGSIIALLGGFVFLFKNYKKQMIALGLIVAAFGWVLMVKFSGSAESIIGREGSTKGHAERMIVGIERFISAPLGQGMGSAGPAYRHVLKLQDTERSQIEEQDRFYIPESWYIQQYIEGGFLGGTLFLVISAIIFFSLFSVSSIIAGMFAGIGAMNLFLHTYESSVVSLLLFIFLGLFLSYAKQRKSYKK